MHLSIGKGSTILGKDHPNERWFVAGRGIIKKFLSADEAGRGGKLGQKGGRGENWILYLHGG